MIFMTDFKKMDIVYELVLFMYHPSGWDSKYTSSIQNPRDYTTLFKVRITRGVYYSF